VNKKANLKLKFDDGAFKIALFGLQISKTTDKKTTYYERTNLQ
jgi:hypothetical protein